MELEEFLKLDKEEQQKIFNDINLILDNVYELHDSWCESLEDCPIGGSRIPGFCNCDFQNY